MLHLTPFEETVSFKEAKKDVLQKDRVNLLTKQIKRRFKFAESTMTRLRERLEKLLLDDLEELFEEIVDMVTLREIKAWDSARTPKAAKGD